MRDHSPTTVPSILRLCKTIHTHCAIWFTFLCKLIHSVHFISQSYAKVSACNFCAAYMGSIVLRKIFSNFSYMGGFVLRKIFGPIDANENQWDDKL